jgi:hypothetical protein
MRYVVDSIARHVAHDPRDERLHALTHIFKVLAEKGLLGG